MHIWNEIKKIIFGTGIYLFNIYVDIYIWTQKQEILQYFYSSKVKWVEPPTEEWICISSMYYNNTYDICNTIIEDYKDIESEYKDYCSKKKYIYPFDTYEIREHLFISKTNNQYFVRTFFPGYKSCGIIDIIQPQSNVEFIYIEYTHPKQTHTIELQLPKGMWIIGNELFTPAFILRLLQQQSTYFYFDLDYKINIIDHEIKNTTLSYQSYIVLDKNGYIIQSI